MLSKQLIESVKKHEAFRDRAYKDSVGVWTIGYGTNLQTTTIDRTVAEEWLINDLNKASNALLQFEAFSFLDPVRRDVLIEMAYNLGINNLKEFKKMWTFLEAGNFVSAANEMLASKWARQVGKRAETLANRMRTGKW